jgi:hypothetical protein
MNDQQLHTPEAVTTENKTDGSIKPPVFTAKKSWNAQKLMSFSAFLISIGTFITFAYQTHLIQKQQFRSVLPYLMINRSSGYNEQGQKMISLQLFNNGIGPAIIEDVTILYHDKEYKTVYDFFVNGVYAENQINMSRNDIKAGFALPAGQTLALLSSNDHQAAIVLEKVLASNDFMLEIVYSSLYEEKWKLTYKHGAYNLKPEKID